MPYLRVIYTRKQIPYDYVSSEVLDNLIMREEISHFYRPRERKWINVRVDLIRGKGGQYEGPERRILALAKEQTAAALRTKGKGPKWIDTLCRVIEEDLPAWDRERKETDLED